MFLKPNYHSKQERTIQISKKISSYVWIASDPCFHFSWSFCMLGQFSSLSSWAIFVACHCLLTCNLSSQLINRVQQTTSTSSDTWKTKTNPKQTNSIFFLLRFLSQKLCRFLSPSLSARKENPSNQKCPSPPR